MVETTSIDDLLHSIFKVLGSYTIDNNGMVEVVGNCIGLRNSKAYTKLPIKFSKVDGVFSISELGLTTLEGSPHTCDTIRFSENFITTWTHCPKNVYTISCHRNRLTNFIGVPQSVHTIFALSNPLVSLEGLPKHMSDLRVTYNKKLPLLRMLFTISPSLDFVGNVVDTTVEEIIRKYSKGKDTTRSDILACQRELIDAGFEGNAAW